MLPLKESPSVIAEKFAEDLTDIFTVILGIAELAAANPQIRGDAKLASHIDQIRRSGRHGSELLRQWVIDGLNNDQTSR